MNDPNKLECLPFKVFQPGLMFEGKPRSLPKVGTLERIFTWVGSNQGILKGEVSLYH
jgi:hypothetical protein